MKNDDSVSVEELNWSAERQVKMSQKQITKHQWLVHSLYGQKYWHLYGKVLSLEKKNALPYEMTVSHMHKSLVFVD